MNMPRFLSRRPISGRGHSRVALCGAPGALALLSAQPRPERSPPWRVVHDRHQRLARARCSATRCGSSCTRGSRRGDPRDVAERPYDLHEATTWIRDAEARHQKILVAFYHSEYTKRKLPSVAAYKRAVAKFVKLFTHVREYQAWDEANRGYVSDGSASFVSPSAAQDAQYYQALKRDCVKCTVVGLDVLDNVAIGGTVQYIEEFKREIGLLKTVMPTVWGLHDYSDLNHFESWRTHDLAADLGGEVWLTETGGVVKFGGAFPNNHGSGAATGRESVAVHVRRGRLHPADQARVHLQLGGRHPLHAVRRRPDERPLQATAGYVVVCKQLRAAHCNVKTVDN